MDLRLSERSKIYWVLDTIVSNQIPVVIEFAAFKLSSKCRLIAVDAVSGYMTVELEPSTETACKLTENQSFSLSANVNGVRIRLTDLSARPVRSNTAAEQFSVKIPQYVYYAQRRDVFRAQVYGYMDVTVSVFAANTFPSADADAMVIGTLDNVSVEGCAVSVQGRCSSEMQNYTLLTVLKLDMPDEQFFPPLFAELRNCRLSSTPETTILGFSFTDNDKMTRRELGMLVTRIQLLARQTSQLSA